MAVLTDELKRRLDQEVSSHPVVLFMKGNALFPRCGFSAAALELLKPHGPVHCVDVLAEPDLRDAVKEYSSWPTLPQVYVHGKFVGGSDIVRELDARGELAPLIRGGS